MLWMQNALQTHRVTDSESQSAWKGPLEIIWPKPLAKPGCNKHVTRHGLSFGMCCSVVLRNFTHLRLSVDLCKKKTKKWSM